jgi:hypothetical protein
VQRRGGKAGHAAAAAAATVATATTIAAVSDARQRRERECDQKLGRPHGLAEFPPVARRSILRL